MNARGLIVGVAFSILAMAAAGSEESPDPAQVERFMDHLRANFEDIHEVSMRFHMEDPSLSGLIVTSLTWEGRRLVSGEILKNETGNDEEAAAIIEAMRGWQIDGLETRCTLTIPFRITLVGSDDPAFAERGILTGSVRDVSGKGLAGAGISVTPSSPAATDSVLADEIKIRANREGIYVRTLIPVGIWDLTCTAEGYRPATILGVKLAPGEHRIEHFTLEVPGEGPEQQPEDGP